MEEALSGALGKPDAVIVDIENNPAMVDFKTHNSTFDLQNLNTYLGVGVTSATSYDITAEPLEKEIQRLQEVINQQQEQISKLSQTWTQRIKNMIGPLV